MSWKRFAIFLLLLLIFHAAEASETPSSLPAKAAVASAHPLATEAGIAILKQGGNAFDAAVAVSAVLGVVEPYGSGIGGGGFWLLHRQSDGFQVMVDGREKAPGAAFRDMYLDAQGEVRPQASINGPLSAGIPGVPAAMAHIASNYGRLPLKTSLQPAIRIAREGFTVDEHYRRYAGYRVKILNQYPAAAAQFLVNGNVPPLGYLLKQPELANTLSLIAEKGRAGFYTGKLAQQLVDGVTKAGGIWSLDDLNNYRVVERRPIVSRLNVPGTSGIKIVSAAPPSSGGIALAEMANMFNQFTLADLNDADKKHLTIEIMRRAYRDRAEYLGDSDYVDVPVVKLTSDQYAKQLVQDIDMQRATPSTALRPAFNPTGKGSDTTHFSILDQEGNRVAATLSVNYLFGSCFVAPGTGVLLNDEMDDFSAKPGVPNAYGLVGAEANAIEPGKRPLSSMSPTFLEDERGIAILGTPGGSRIISMVMLGAMAYAEGGDAGDLVRLPRFHHQYLPDKVFYEAQAFNAKTVGVLKGRGHTLHRQQNSQGDDSTYGNMQAVVWDKRNNNISAASDPRGIGRAWVYP
ncbi:MAG: gamma-glutamyltransferase [Gammaproteobacteria bacterium]|nr:gamma-glutamyltransferase [Gammaproteobacteria bacterium]